MTKLLFVSADYILANCTLLVNLIYSLTPTSISAILGHTHYVRRMQSIT